jgi:hypothetical protein
MTAPNPLTPLQRMGAIALLSIILLFVGALVYQRTQRSPEAQSAQDSADEINRQLEDLNN